MIPKTVSANKVARVVLASIITAAITLSVPACFMPAGGVFAATDSNGNGHAASELKVYVGYAGYPYEERKTYTPESLMAVGGEVRQLYTWIDNMPAPCLNPARGVKLSDILSDAGIDYASAERIHFTCNDEHETQELTAPYLFDVTKYYYPHLFECWEYESLEQGAGRAGFGAESDRERVETIIAVEDVWQRMLSASEPWKGFGDMDGARRFRLVFGMTDTVARTAYNSAMWIESIEVMLAGAPPRQEIVEEEKEEEEGQQDEKVGSEKGDNQADAKNNSKDDEGKDKSESDKGNKDKDKTDKDKDSKDKVKAEKDKDKKKADPGQAGDDKDIAASNAESAGENQGSPGSGQRDATTSAGAIGGGVTVAALTGGAREMSVLGGKMLKELTLDGVEGVDGGQSQGAYQPWRVHDISDDAVWLKAAGLRGDLEGPVGIGLGGLAAIGAALYFLGIKRGIF
ncbi:MAG: hypothetical protein LBJ91_00360 [Clostridiales Family XIII bacterium]|jgi:hypothetical protein|nr:hypothetical protein [Clostridiales Family XIII bacterium]